MGVDCGLRRKGLGTQCGMEAVRRRGWGLDTEGRLGTLVEVAGSWAWGSDWETDPEVPLFGVWDKSSHTILCSTPLPQQVTGTGQERP